MKLGTSGLDDLLNELLYVIDQDSSRLARAVRWFFVRGYRGLKTAMLLALRWKWRAGQQVYPPIGYEPFNLTPAELADEWGQNPKTKRPASDERQAGQVSEKNLCRL